MNTSKRIFLWDNLKFILITLVVIGHFIEPSTYGSKTASLLFIFIYVFHMPLFIFLTGYFSKNTINNENGIKLNKIFSYFILFVISTGIIDLILYILYPGYQFDLRKIAYSPWYLFATCVWFMITYIFKKVKPKWMLIISIILGIAVGYISSFGDFFASSRIITFYPFFLVGYYLTEDKSKKLVSFLKRDNIKYASVVFLLVAIVVMISGVQYMQALHEYYTARVPYDGLHYLNNGYIIRIFCYITSILFSLAVISLTPTKELFISHLGKRTLQIYILHMPIVIIMLGLGYTQFLCDYFKPIWFILLVMTGIALSLILSSNHFTKPFTKIMNLKFKKILDD